MAFHPTLIQPGVTRTIKGVKVRKRTSIWWAQWYDEQGKQHRISTKLSDKAAAQKFCTALKKRLEREYIEGVYDPAFRQKKRPIEEFIKEYERHLQDDQRDERYIGIVVSHIKKIVSACRLATITDINAVVVGNALGDLIKAGASRGTRNCYLRDMTAFCNWLADTDKLYKNPILSIKKLNEAVDRRRERRILTPADFGRLVEAAKAGEVICNMSGKDRALAYTIAAYTGYRLGAVHSLCPSCFVWNAGDAGCSLVVLTPKASKNKKENPATPLQPELAGAIRAHIKANKLQPTDKLFPDLDDHASSRGMKADLAAAKIPQVVDGKYFDFHSLRHQFASWLSSTGTGLGVAQKLMHHSSPSLTNGVYTHTALADFAAAIGRLPKPPKL
jgi:integrase